jgi:hypothetical protein
MAVLLVGPSERRRTVVHELLKLGRVEHIYSSASPLAVYFLD